jgi:hypothetical protein
MFLEKKLAEKRLTEAYNNAKIEYFDNNSKYIFSVTVIEGIVHHLMDLQKIKISFYSH